jgi:hypothetical protein
MQVWLNNVSVVHLIQISLLLIGQQGLGHFFRYQALVSHWLQVGCPRNSADTEFRGIF